MHKFFVIFVGPKWQKNNKKQIVLFVHPTTMKKEHARFIHMYTSE